jgi:lipopolysaccharide/colanic/teichoic acid biosynthesis glycosyltransferase
VGRGLGRFFDLAVAVIVLVCGAPLWLSIALAVRLTSRGPALHRATRCGQGGESFELLKYRSMRIEGGPGITASRDPRITPVGAVLRTSKLDEIPQMVNVLRGEMAIVGPRPEDPRFVDLTNPVQQLVLSVRPGLTSRASVEYRHEQQLLARTDDLELVYRNEVLPEKLRLDAEWLRNRTVSSDLRIVVDTVLAIFRRSSA